MSYETTMTHPRPFRPEESPRGSNGTSGAEETGELT